MDYAKWFSQGIDKSSEPKERTKTMQMLAERLGYAHYQHLYGFIKGKQQLSSKQIEIAAEFFGVEAPNRKNKPPRSNGHVHTEPAARAPSPSNVLPFRPTVSPLATATATSETVPYPVLGVVAAGAFMEADILAQVEPREVGGPRSTAFPNATTMAWEAHGDSMNEARIFDGTILLGVDFQEAGVNLASDMIVVVEQNRGGLIERSVKAVAVFPDRIEFQPRSTNPVHKPIVYNRSANRDDVEVRVLTVIHCFMHMV